MQLTARASADITADRETVFSYITSGVSWPQILPPLFPLPGIRSVTLLDGDTPAPGVRRRVIMTDGTELVETVDDHRPPNVHQYSWGDGLSPPLSRIVRRAVACWKLDDNGRTTQVTWTYTFTLTGPLVLPVAWLIVRRFQTWMKRGLRQVQQATAGRHSDRTKTTSAG